MNRIAKPGTLYIVATPIGNTADITERALSVLEQTPLTLAEDTRTTKNLLSFYPGRRFHGQILRLDDTIQGIRLHNIVDQIHQGLDAALVSEAGTPQINDPGHALIKECVKQGIRVVPIPGASALATIISIADFRAQPVAFYGFLPKKKGRATTLRRMRDSGGKYGITSVIIYEAPVRVRKTLEELQTLLGPNVRVVIGRELTKKFEEIWYGTLATALEHFVSPRGEFTLLVQLQTSGS